MRRLSLKRLAPLYRNSIFSPSDSAFSIRVPCSIRGSNFLAWEGFLGARGIGKKCDYRQDDHDRNPNERKHQCFTSCYINRRSFLLDAANLPRACSIASACSGSARHRHLAAERRGCLIAVQKIYNCADNTPFRISCVKSGSVGGLLRFPDHVRIGKVARFYAGPPACDT